MIRNFGHCVVRNLKRPNFFVANVVPLAQEARRKGILPVNLLSPDEETWVYA